ncbi:flagellar M-ring protein FliF [Altererythrobacter soli]|uniref:Flagellar M-ring protein n=1 Tax=Croceibacterium soli TaxID=1739690 RepID=A0A6I4UUY9_9SPHN|nr:flagellar basal-body MS-ring/collar protein FliF [Croceibacterium soli]MXP41569.1 flagellar M-ring protein FliF [Croceibacterium soli]
MSELVPAANASGSLLTPLRDARGGSVLTRLGAFAAQPPVRKALPWFAGVAGVGLLALVWAGLSPAPQRVLYSSLSDAERAEVVGALDKASIDYTIDSATGALTVAEDDLYRARMLVASDGALAAPESGTDMLDALPMGASRTLEGDRLRAAQERDLTLTIMEIDGVEAVRVHLGRAERSVFVRENLAPTASVMVRMARGRQMADSQVNAIANLVAGSVPGLTIDAVQIVDQHGRLLSQAKNADSDRLELQSRIEGKLRMQVEQLLSPMIGTGNFSSEIQVELDMNEVTSARESYDKDGAIRRETTQRSQAVAGGAIGVPGVLANTPPAAAEARPDAPDGEAAPAAPQASGESSATRTFELGREVAVSNITPGSVKRLSVAVALNQDALKGAKAADFKKFERLVAAAVGANPERGDTVAVIVRPFQAAEIEAVPFWETAWFGTILRNVVALIAVLLVLFLAVRPIVKALTRRKSEAEEAGGGEPRMIAGRQALVSAGQFSEMPDRERLSAQIELAQRIVREQPDDALQALRRMLGEAQGNEGAAR